MPRTEDVGRRSERREPTGRQAVAPAYIAPVTAFDRLGNVYRRALYNQAHPEPIALYSVLLCEATSTNHPAHDYFAARYTRVLDTVAAQVRDFQEQGLFRSDLDPEAEAAWFTALWDGLQVHALYADSGAIPEQLLRGLDELVADSVPADRRVRALTASP